MGQAGDFRYSLVTLDFTRIRPEIKVNIDQADDGGQQGYGWGCEEIGGF